MLCVIQFNDYVRKYLTSFPELTRQDFPTFDEFDFEPDGTISFTEWQRFLAKQKLLDSNNSNENKETKSVSSLLGDSKRRQHTLNG